MTPCTIYALTDATGAIRYIGKTRHQAHRLDGHLFEARTGHACHRCKWIRSLPAVPVLKPLVIVADADSSEMERRVIALYSARGSRLVNNAAVVAAARAAQFAARAARRERRTIARAGTIAEEIRALRAALGENTTTFAARWRRSRRTIEDWEQGRVQPDAFVLAAMRTLAARMKNTSKRKHV